MPSSRGYTGQVRATDIAGTRVFEPISVIGKMGIVEVTLRSTESEDT